MSSSSTEPVLIDSGFINHAPLNERWTLFCQPENPLRDYLAANRAELRNTTFTLEDRQSYHPSFRSVQAELIEIYEKNTFVLDFLASNAITMYECERKESSLEWRQSHIVYYKIRFHSKPVLVKFVLFIGLRYTAYAAADRRWTFYFFCIASIQKQFRRDHQCESKGCLRFRKSLHSWLKRQTVYDSHDTALFDHICGYGGPIYKDSFGKKTEKLLAYPSKKQSPASSSVETDKVTHRYQSVELKEESSSDSDEDSSSGLCKQCSRSDFVFQPSKPVTLRVKKVDALTHTKKDSPEWTRGKCLVYHLLLFDMTLYC